MATASSALESILAGHEGHPGIAALERYLHAGVLAPATRDAALADYAQPLRHYHGVGHLLELLALAASLDLGLSREQVLALLYHDVVYVPGAPHGENERQSAARARRDAQAFAAGIDIDCVCTIILDTIEHVPSRPESALVLDLDLSPLAAEPARFAEVNEEVWLEFQPLFGAAANARAEFDRRRLAFLEALLAKGPLFRVLTQLEARARANVAALRGQTKWR